MSDNLALIAPRRRREPTGRQSLRAIDWVQDGPTEFGHISLLDQTELPARATTIDVRSVDALIGAIRWLAVRGAPALGAAGAMRVALAADTLSDKDLIQGVHDRRGARPTAVNLAGGVDRAWPAHEDGGPRGALQATVTVRDDDVAACKATPQHGTRYIRESVPGAGQVRLMAICNSGALAAVEHGTDLGVVDIVGGETPATFFTEKPSHTAAG